MEEINKNQPQARLKPLFSRAVVGALVFFVLLWKLDFPKPMWDDLFYNGAALNMAEGGDFSNPLLARQGFPSHYFFVYPPLHSYVVYWWLSCWGVSAASLLAFQNLMYFIIAWMMIVILRRHAAPEILSWLVPWGITAVFMKTGLRPEPLAVALTMAGYTFLLHCRKPGFCLWFSFLLMFLGASAAPRTAFYAAAFVLVGGWQFVKQGPSKISNWLRCGGAAALALGAALLVFMVLIGFRLSEFLKTFHMHAGRIEDGRLQMFHRFMVELGVRWWPIFVLTFLLLCAAVRRPASAASRLCYWLVATFVFAGVASGLGAGASWYVIFILFLLAATLAKDIPRARSFALQFAIASLLLLANSTKLIEALGILTGKIDNQPSENRQTVLAMRSAAEHPLLVDHNVGRYVFDYQLPPGSIDYGFSAPFPGFVATDTKLRAEDIFVIGPGCVQLLNKATQSHFPLESWTFFGLKNWSYWKHPRQAYVIPARDCMKLNDDSAAK